MKGLRELAFEDVETRPIYADWLEEQGDPRADFWREFIGEKRPFMVDGVGYQNRPEMNDPPWFLWSNEGRWRESRDINNEYWKASLPREVYILLKGEWWLRKSEENSIKVWKQWCTLEEAWSAVENAWLLVKEKGVECEGIA